MGAMWGIVLGAVLLWAIPTGADADGAVAIGLPVNVAKEGVAVGSSWNYPSPDAAAARALQECLGAANLPAETRRLCKVVRTFKDECLAFAADRKAGTPGFGWAVGATQAAANESAVQNCKKTAGRDRQQFCEITSSRCEGKAAAAADVGDPEDCRVQSGDVAIEACNRVINSGKYPRETLANAYVDRGQEYYLKKDYERALSDFSTAIRLNAGSGIPRAFVNRGNVHHAQGQDEAALSDYSQAIGLDSNFTAAYTGRGRTRESLGREEEAIADYKKALSVPQKSGDGKWAHDKARERLKALGVGE